MKAARIFLLFASCCILTTTLIGCSTLSDNSDPKSANPGVLEPQAILKFSDVPVPVGLKVYLINHTLLKAQGYVWVF